MDGFKVVSMTEPGKICLIKEARKYRFNFKIKIIFKLKIEDEPYALVFSFSDALKGYLTKTGGVDRLKAFVSEMDKKSDDVIKEIISRLNRMGMTENTDFYVEVF